MRDAVFEVLRGCQIGRDIITLFLIRKPRRLLMLFNLPSTPQPTLHNHTKLAMFCYVRFAFSLLLHKMSAHNFTNCAINDTTLTFLNNIANACTSPDRPSITPHLHTRR